MATHPFIVALTPVTIILGTFTLISFGFFVAMNAITPVWLQKPVKEGGYGFTSRQNALCKPFLSSLKLSLNLQLTRKQFHSRTESVYLLLGYTDN